MTARRWPILDLDDGATEAEMRRAYAKRLREQGPDADVAAFQALRSEFEDALASVRAGTRDRSPLGETTRVCVLPRTIVDPSVLAREQIAQFLADEQLVRACDRFDAARASNEIDLASESQIELDLAQHWLKNTALDAATLAAIVQRYRWIDVGSNFPLAPQIVARLRAQPNRVATPGRRFIGTWNWGAFLLTPFWLIAHGLSRCGAYILVLSVVSLAVPLLVFGILFMAIYYGRKGNELAVTHRLFVDEAQFVAVQNAWRNWGLSLWTGLPISVMVAAWLLVATSVHSSAR